MNEVTISKGRFTVMCVAIVVLLILVILLYLKQQPPLLANVLNFQKTLTEGKFSGAALVKPDGTLAVFGQDLLPVKPCGESTKPTTIPSTCTPEPLGNPSALNPVTVIIFPDTNTVLFRTDDPWYSLCRDGTYGPPCHH